MSHSYRVLRRIVIFLSIMTVFLSVLPVTAQEQPTKHLITMGGGYSDIYAGFAQEAVANVKNGQVNVLVLPLGYSTRPDAMTDAERAASMRDAEERRFQIEEACKRAAPPEVTCQAALAPILTRSDAGDSEALRLFTEDLSAIFILGSDQTTATQIVIDTPLEKALARAYAGGVIIAGTGAGGSLQSAEMLAGYQPGFAAGNSLQFGASEVWNTPQQHGLLFSIRNAIVDQLFFQRGRLGLLLNAIVRPDAPHLGIGVDAYTGVNVYDETRLQDVFGLYTTTILDADTYHAADAAQYAAPDNLLRLRNVLVQMLSPGKFSYDLNKRIMSVGTRAQPPEAIVTREFKALTLPRKAGPLILAGDLSEALDDNAILKRFVTLAGGDQAEILIVAAGFPSQNSAQDTAEKYAAALGVPSHTVVVPNQDEELKIPAGTTGLLLIAKDQSKVVVSLLDAVKAAWANGLPLLADNGGAAVVGRSFSAHGPTPQGADEAESAVQKSFLQGTTMILNGLGLLDIAIEPQLLNDNRWGRLFSLAYNKPDTVAFGLAQNTALEITQDGARTIGDSVVFALDLRNAVLDLGTNDGFVIANGLLDVFTPGDAVKPSVADVKAAPTRVPTPVLPTPTPTSTPAAAPTGTPTPVLTSTSVPTPTPTSTPAATATPEISNVPAAVSPSSSFALVPLAVGAGLIIFVIVLVAGRRRK